MHNNQSVYIFGAGGHAKVICEVFELMNVEIKAFVLSEEMGTLGPRQFLGRPCLSESEFYSKNDNAAVFVAIGDNFVRAKISKRIQEKKKDFRFINAIHPNSVISRNCRLGQGVTVLAGAIINFDAVVGDHCVLNTGSILEHDCVMGDFSFLAPGAILGGKAKIGDYSLVGIGAKILNGISMGGNSILGGGSVLVKNLESDVVAYGVPATVHSKRQLGDSYF